MNHLPLFLTALLLSMPWQLRAQPSPPATLPEAQAQLESSQARADTLLQERLEALHLRYALQLDRIRQQAQDAGDLDATLAILREQNYVREHGRQPPPDGQARLPQVEPVRQVLETAIQQMQQEHAQARRLLLQAHLAHLQSLQRDLTMENRIDEAVEVREEARRVAQQLEAPAAAPAPGPAPAAAPAPDFPRLALRWQTGMPQNQVELILDQDRRLLEMQHEGPNRLTPRGLLLRGGRTRVPNIGETLRDAFMASNTWSLMVDFETRGLDQQGPARILSFSRDAGNRNFTLGQQGDQLVLRLRTPATGKNAIQPEVTLLRLQANTRYRVVLTYTSDTLTLFHNGQETALPGITGDFRNWDPYEFVLGNEANDDRPWSGILNAFHLQNVLFSPEQARRFSQTH